MENKASVTSGTTTENSKNQKDSLEQFFENIQTKTYKPYKTDISFFDDLLSGGLIRGTLTILLAAPGAGKTALCAQMGEAMAEHEKPVIYLNLEMTEDQMLARSISSRATLKGVPVTSLQVMQGYNWTDEQRGAITEAVDEYRRAVYPYMKYSPEKLETTVDGIKDYLTKIGEAARQAGKEAPAIILDYLHLVTGNGDPQETVKKATFALKEYAATYNTISIAIAAVNRDSIKDGSISMASGRDSSGIEFTADYLLGLNYFECEQPAKIKGQDGKPQDNKCHVNPMDTERMAHLLRQEVRKMVLRVLKGRFIEPGRSVDLKFHAPSARFYGETDFIPSVDDDDPFGDEDMI